MSADNVASNVKNTVFPLVAGGLVNGAAPARQPNSNSSSPRRNLLVIQNTGANPIRYRFDQPVQNDGGDIELAPKAKDTYQNPCPQQSVSLFSTLGSTVAIVEGLET